RHRSPAALSDPAAAGRSPVRAPRPQMPTRTGRSLLLSNAVSWSDLRRHPSNALATGVAMPWRAFVTIRPASAWTVRSGGSQARAFSTRRAGVAHTRVRSLGHRTQRWPRRRRLAGREPARRVREAGSLDVMSNREELITSRHTFR